MFSSFAVTIATGLLVAGFAVSHADPLVTTTQVGPANSPLARMTDGEVRKIDREAGKITLRHGPIANLDMPGMTMVFRVKDSGMLDRVKEGDKVRFVAERMNGALTVVQIEQVP